MLISLAGLVTVVGFASMEGVEHEVMLSGVPSVIVSHYDIRGANLQDLHSQTIEKGPRDQFGSQRDAYTKWHIWWEWPEDSEGRALLHRTQVYSEIEVTLPRVVDIEVLTQADRASWSRYIEAVRRHELGHVEMARKTRDEIEFKILEQVKLDKNFSAQQGNKLGQGLLRRLRQQDLEYDQSTKHGATQGVQLEISLKHGE